MCPYVSSRTFCDDVTFVLLGGGDDASLVMSVVDARLCPNASRLKDHLRLAGDDVDDDEGDVDVTSACGGCHVLAGPLFFKLQRMRIRRD